jgi:hypothetical protein
MKKRHFKADSKNRWLSGFNTKLIIKNIFNYKIVILVLFICLCVCQVSSYLYYQNKFRFEHFQTAQELIAHLKINYPVGSDNSTLRKSLEEVGAKCEQVRKEYISANDPIGTEAIVFCKYNTGWLSLTPLINYSVGIYLDINNKIIDIGVSRFEGFK